MSPANFIDWPGPCRSRVQFVWYSRSASGGGPRTSQPSVAAQIADDRRSRDPDSGSEERRGPGLSSALCPSVERGSDPLQSRPVWADTSLAKVHNHGPHFYLLWWFILNNENEQFVDLLVIFSVSDENLFFYKNVFQKENSSCFFSSIKQTIQCLLCICICHSASVLFILLDLRIEFIFLVSFYFTSAVFKLYLCIKEG